MIEFITDPVNLTIILITSLVCNALDYFIIKSLRAKLSNGAPDQWKKDFQSLKFTIINDENLSDSDKRETISYLYRRGIDFYGRS